MDSPINDKTKSAFVEIVNQTLFSNILESYQVKLAGGTALAMRLHHRDSVDLDFVVNAREFSKHKVKHLMEAIGASKVYNPDVYQEMIDLGDPDNYQQDWLFNDVKVTFSTLSAAQRKLIFQESDADNPLIASLGSLFDSKSHLVSCRKSTRDLFDLFTMFRMPEFGFSRFYDAYEKAGEPFNTGAGIDALLKAKYPLDEGFNALLESPPTIETMQATFQSWHQDFLLSIQSSSEPKKH